MLPGTPENNRTILKFAFNYLRAPAVVLSPEFFEIFRGVFSEEYPEVAASELESM